MVAAAGGMYILSFEHKSLWKTPVYNSFSNDKTIGNNNNTIENAK